MLSCTCRGSSKKKQGIVDNYLGRTPYQGGGKNLWTEVDKSRGKHAITVWQKKLSGTLASLIRCFPKTGITHQIRLHLKQLGHPILGDYKYTKLFRCPYPAKRCMLHAFSIAFRHPCTQELLKVEAPLPEDFQQAINKLFSMSKFFLLQ